ncbi:RXT2-like protein [Plectosphaerella plurivora]|uniref:RXT2-like protein n=1 Tax=Plectosphaerella plurivora TaxID=936078 RepID=A0A9P8VLU8_9PEZI|nr:RXT2-like protein [Plectosphaerella plurivora]
MAAGWAASQQPKRRLHPTWLCLSSQGKPPFFLTLAHHQHNTDLPAASPVYSNGERATTGNPDYYGYWGTFPQHTPAPALCTSLRRIAHFRFLDTRVGRPSPTSNLRYGLLRQIPSAAAMASQQVLFGETIAAMKKAIKRTAYESDSDDEIEHYTNRGNKLKKRALFAHQGQLIPPSGPEVYRQNIDYAGQTRSIINQNPPILDDEGFELDSEDDVKDQRVRDAMTYASEMNPYASIRLEQLLAPLTAATDLPTHPTLSKSFTSETLTGLVRQGCEVVRKENQSLWRTRHLFTRLMGDHTWAPCGMMIGPNDVDLFTDAIFDQKEAETVDDKQGDLHQSTNGSTLQEPSPGGTQNADHVARDETATPNTDAKANGATTQIENIEHAESNGTEAQKPKETEPKTDSTLKVNGTAASTKGSGANTPVGTRAEEGPENGDVEMQQDEPSEEQGAAANSTTVKPDEAVSATSQPDDTFIHPIFMPPAGAHPDKGGLSEAEAEEMRRLVALYVQKQEEVCRGAHKLHEGLLRAERLRQTVLKWSKIEAHCGPNRDLSDGEDWYDKEEWGLSEDLKKGQDEEEEDNTATATKKTRNRR